MSKLSESVFEERPTKLEIPNSSPLGGDMDGMGDLDNAPIPPMGADNIGMDGQMGSPDDMGGEDDELMDIINSLSIEDKAAVTKYAKSMANNSEGGEMPQDDMGAMPMESKKSINNIIDETINDVLDNQEGAKRPEKKLPKEYRHMKSPFISPF